ncbi:methylamine utilization protein MauE (plasmid) [Streptomyces nigrescens]|uniref:Methylamine utilization protein MauE n=2 Tax=Streptomyces TaxID=1883 RepID=A0ABN6RA36_STRNI|nr:MauE/DoxX family redox-associated membrane protein [Streptomyces nigrescens]MEE4420659.1 MauE/DoxX family redox-associated membrane protein [Streptomyces sp. DSM 41528]BDM74622.1 methylamine utilization protein MauE [Streptomyces nigrescens]
MDILAVACASCLAVVFGAAALGKVRSRAAFSRFAQSLTTMDLLPAGWVRPCAVLVAGSEVAVLLLLLASPLTAPAGLVAFLLAAGLLLAFTSGAALMVVRGVRAECRCFGASGTPMGRLHVLRNGVLTLIAAGGALSSSDIGAVAPAYAAVAVAGGAVVGALVTRLEDLAALFRPSLPARPEPARD